MSGGMMMSGALFGKARAEPADAVTAIDCHAHIFERGLGLAGNRRYAPDYDATLADYLVNLDANGCSHGVLVQPSFLGTDNSYLIAALKRHAGRLRGIAVIEPTLSAGQLEELDETGIVGIHSISSAWPIRRSIRLPGARCSAPWRISTGRLRYRPKRGGCPGSWSPS